jgi:hypothetical protein
MTLSNLSRKANMAMPGFDRIKRIEDDRKNPSRMRSIWLGVSGVFVTLPQVVFATGSTLIIPIAVAIWGFLTTSFAAVLWLITAIVLGFAGKLEDYDPNQDAEPEEEDATFEEGARD